MSLLASWQYTVIMAKCANHTRRLASWWRVVIYKRLREVDEDWNEYAEMVEVDKEEAFSGEGGDGSVEKEELTM